VVEEGVRVVVAWRVYMQVPPLRIATCRDASVGMTAVGSGMVVKGRWAGAFARGANNPSFAMKLQRMGHPDSRLVEKRIPRLRSRMTNKYKDRSRFFAALRMTIWKECGTGMNVQR
jgi:hypothetical protein